MPRRSHAHVLLSPAALAVCSDTVTPPILQLSSPVSYPMLQVHVSYLEIYNETGFDLLDPDREVKAMEDLPQV